MGKRWINHHRYAELEQIGNVRIAWIQVSEPQLLPLIEDALIKYFKPLLNQRNVKVRKRYSDKKQGNPNPKYKFKTDSLSPVAKSCISVKLDKEHDKYVRSLPNRTEWLRKAIARQVEEDLAAEKSKSA